MKNDYTKMVGTYIIRQINGQHSHFTKLTTSAKIHKNYVKEHQLFLDNF